MPKEYFYKGRSIWQLTKEELMDAYADVFDQLELMRKWEREDRQMEHEFTLTRDHLIGINRGLPRQEK